MCKTLSDYDFFYSEEKTALRPITPRGDAKMLHFDGEIHDLHVRDYPSLFSDNDMLVFNDTKVLAARLDGLRLREIDSEKTQTPISVTLLGSLEGSLTWQALIKPLKKIEIGEEIIFAPEFSARLVAKKDGIAHLKFAGEDFSSNLAKYGRMPLPPYIENMRRADDQDKTDYQPYLAKHRGAVASPTASLHFDEELMAAIKAKGVLIETITLHVGAGTFLPIRADNYQEHQMHSELGVISEATAERINAHKKRGGRVIAVGTTSLRLLESAAQNGVLNAFDGSTDIFIQPGYRFEIVDGLITNFHQPRSTLLILVASFIGYENMRKIYEHALQSDYRFFSYGDSSFLWRGKGLLIK